MQSPCGRRRTRPSSISTGTVGGIEVLITTQVYGLQMVTIPILALLQIVGGDKLIIPFC
ncbi:TPA: hypothetical protein ACIDM0_004304 [Shigella flexneri]